MKLSELFFSFSKIGVMTFGGGYAMLPMLQKICVEDKKWVTEDELLNYYAIGQCTPGVIAVNTATFIGTKYRGVLGGIIASLGVVFPSFLIISILASILSVLKDNYYFIKAFSGIRIAVCALILSSVIKLCKSSKLNAVGYTIALIVFCLQLFVSLNSIYIVIITVFLSSIYYLLFKKEKKL